MCRRHTLVPKVFLGFARVTPFLLRLFAVVTYKATRETKPTRDTFGTRVKTTGCIFRTKAKSSKQKQNLRNKSKIFETKQNSCMSTVWTSSIRSYNIRCKVLCSPLNMKQYVCACSTLHLSVIFIEASTHCVTDFNIMTR